MPGAENLEVNVVFVSCPCSAFRQLHLHLLRLDCKIVASFLKYNVAAFLRPCLVNSCLVNNANPKLQADKVTATVCDGRKAFLPVF